MTQADILEELLRARAMWCRWHNPASRRWFRAALVAYRQAAWILPSTEIVHVEQIIEYV